MKMTDQLIVMWGMVRKSASKSTRTCSVRICSWPVNPRLRPFLLDSHVSNKPHWTLRSPSIPYGAFNPALVLEKTAGVSLFTPLTLLFSSMWVLTSIYQTIEFPTATISETKWRSQVVTSQQRAKLSFSPVKQQVTSSVRTLTKLF